MADEFIEEEIMQDECAVYPVLDGASVTVKGIAGALFDLGYVGFDELSAAAKAMALPEFEIGLETVRGCSGIEIKIKDKSMLTEKQLDEKIAALRAYDESAGTLLSDIYDHVQSVCGEEQGFKEASLGSFCRADVFLEIAFAALAIAAAEEDAAIGLTVTPIELGGGTADDHGVAVDRPSTLTTRFLTDMKVTAHPSAEGIDIPAAAVVSVAVENETNAVDGVMLGCGCGIDGGRVTRVYMIGADDED